MTATDLGGRTEWEHRQYLKDHGRRAAVVQAHRDFADFLETDEDSPAPPPDVTVGACRSAEAVDRWAARHHVTAEWRQGSYRAVVDFGKEYTYCVAYVPKEVLDERLDSAEAQPEMAGAA